MAKISKVKKRKAIQKRKSQMRLSIGFLMGFAIIFASWAVSHRSELAKTDQDPASLPIAPEVDAQAPDFKLPKMNGGEVALSDFKGKSVVMMFFHTW